MTGKQGAAEWLREKAQSVRRAKGFGCKELMVSEFGESCDGRRCADCYADLFERIAGRIDAERALPEGVEWPRFEDGGLVRIGDEVEYKCETMRVYLATLDADGGEPAVDLVYAGQILRWHSVNPEKLTHERPDSWILWVEDLDMAVKAGEVDKVKMMRRAKALAKADSEARGVE